MQRIGWLKDYYKVINVDFWIIMSSIDQLIQSQKNPLQSILFDNWSELQGQFLAHTLSKNSISLSGSTL